MTTLRKEGIGFVCKRGSFPVCLILPTVSQAEVCAHKVIWEPLDFTVSLCSFLKGFLSSSFLHFPLPFSPFCGHHLLSFCAPHPAIVSLFLHMWVNFCLLSLPQLSFSPLFFPPLLLPLLSSPLFSFASISCVLPLLTRPVGASSCLHLPLPSSSAPAARLMRFAWRASVKRPSNVLKTRRKLQPYEKERTRT